MRGKVLALSTLSCIAASAFGGGVLVSQSRALSCDMMVGSFCHTEGSRSTCEFNGSQETMTCSGGTWEVTGVPTTSVGTN